MNIGLRGLLLLLATILFIVAALNDDNFTDLVSVGLAAFAVAFVVEETGFGRTSARDESAEPTSPQLENPRRGVFLVLRSIIGRVRMLLS
jgi:hypothetical protein